MRCPVNAWSPCTVITEMSSHCWLSSVPRPCVWWQFVCGKILCTSSVTNVLLVSVLRQRMFACDHHEWHCQSCTVKSRHYKMQLSSRDSTSDGCTHPKWGFIIITCHNESSPNEGFVLAAVSSICEIKTNFIFIWNCGVMSHTYFPSSLRTH